MGSSDSDWKQGAAVAAIAALIAFARMPDRFLHGFLWAEDGRIFLVQAHYLGFRSIVTPYAGYLHVVPRVIALAFSKIAPVGAVPLPFAWVSAAILCASCAYLFTFARKVVPTPAAWTFALSPILVPHIGEVWLTVTNLQWVLAPALLVLLVETFCSPLTGAPGSRGDTLRGIAIVVLSLTGPFCLLFLPIILLCLIATRRVSRPRSTWLAIGAYFISCLVQLVMLIVSPAEDRGARGARHSLMTFAHFPWKEQFLHYVALDFVMPTAWSNRMGNHWPVAAIACAVAVIACCMFAGKNRRVFCCALVAIAAGLWVLGIVRADAWTIVLKWDVVGGRYFYEPFIFLTWAVLLSLVTSPYPAIQFLAGSILTMVMLNSISMFNAPDYPPSTVTATADGSAWMLNVPPSPYWDIKIQGSDLFNSSKW
ncbi:hypothetical protein [Paraburkholderia sediminicola]|uniref:hypothetical protein n=1 Tax=Paraburkholderia sediminicola TaxID=458836 RepID=UPI0038B86F41